MEIIGAELYLKETKYRHLRQFPKPKSMTKFLGILRKYAKSIRKNGFWREDPIAYQATLNVQNLMNLWEDKYLFKPKNYYFIRIYYNSRVVECTLPETEVIFYDDLLKYFKEGALNFTVLKLEQKIPTKIPSRNEYFKRIIYLTVI